jgi:hypothetical protein
MFQCLTVQCLCVSQRASKRKNKAKNEKKTKNKNKIEKTKKEGKKNTNCHNNNKRREKQKQIYAIGQAQLVLFDAEYVLLLEDGLRSQQCRLRGPGGVHTITSKVKTEMLRSTTPQCEHSTGSSSREGHWKRDRLAADAPAASESVRCCGTTGALLPRFRISLFWRHMWLHKAKMLVEVGPQSWLFRNDAACRAVPDEVVRPCTRAAAIRHVDRCGAPWFLRHVVQKNWRQISDELRSALPTSESKALMHVAPLVAIQV